ncbi:hypothetical protein SDC9_76258 [bioreactor metagenome]|uniref:Uncharacterized protein n=1 Tax=bioreactor metagenome TaxID=1076179 RepID=A0A644YP06_9ZZZZ
MNDRTPFVEKLDVFIFDVLQLQLRFRAVPPNIYRKFTDERNDICFVQVIADAPLIEADHIQEEVLVLELKFKMLVVGTNLSDVRQGHILEAEHRLWIISPIRFQQFQFLQKLQSDIGKRQDGIDVNGFAQYNRIMVVSRIAVYLFGEGG